MDTVVRRFAARLHSLRLERNLTQEALASRAKLHLSFISSLERAAKIPSLTTLEQLARALNVEIASLVDFPGEKGSQDDRRNDEIAIVSRRLKTCDLPTARRIRKAVEAFTG